MEKFGSHWTDFHEIWYAFLEKLENTQVLLKSDKNNGYPAWKAIYIFDYLAQFFLEWNMFQTKSVEEIKTRVLDR